jgi:curved DNA-binding protein CbpA
MKWTIITLTLAVAQVKSANAFVMLRPPCGTVTTSTTRTTTTEPSYRHNKSSRTRFPTTTRLLMNANSNDPFLLLGLDEPTSDKAVIKRAYKRMALKFHPDMATTKDSTAQEKKEASDIFAKINWAYQVLSGKRKDDTTYGKQTGSGASSSGSGASSTSGWTPPHRRSGAYSSPGESTSSGTGASTDWRDYMPKKEEEDAKYDTGGDSLGQIFSDLFTGAAGAAAGAAAGYGGSSSSSPSSSIFKDFVDFLEGNIDGYGGGSRDDADLRVLLQTASLQEIGNEMDDTDLVVQQLNTKMGKLKDEIIMVQAEVKLQQRYLERMELEESMAELEARKQVVDGYLKKAQKRLLALQVRYKELITRGDNDSYAGGGRKSQWDEIKKEATTTSGSSSRRSSPSSPSGGSGGSTASSSPYSSRGSSSTSSSSSSSRTSGSTSTANNDDEDAWMNEGFGSSRGRGSSGRRRRSSQTSSSSGPSTGGSSSTSSSQSRRTDSFNTQPQPEPVRPPRSPQSQESVRPPTGSSSTSSSSGSPSSASSYVPPHRRTSDFSSEQDDKRRMRDMKVDEEFDKLKKELGL